MSETCRTSCRFLLLVFATPANDCPPVTSSVTSSSSSSPPPLGVDTVAACARDCETDVDCDVISHRCCADGCNRHCRPAVRRFHDGKITQPSLEVAPTTFGTKNSTNNPLASWLLLIFSFKCLLSNHDLASLVASIQLKTKQNR